MSKLGLLGKDLKHLPAIIEQYENDLSGYEKNLTLVGKILEKALQEQHTWTAYYNERAVEINTIVKKVESYVKSVRGKLVIQLNENHSRSLGERLIEKYIDQEPEYLNAYEILLEVEELYDKYKALLDSFNRRGFILRDIVQARIHTIHQDTL